MLRKYYVADELYAVRRRPGRPKVYRKDGRKLQRTKMMKKVGSKSYKVYKPSWPPKAAEICFRVISKRILLRSCEQC